ncbi:hydrolase TatD [Lewinellaceae bacterium SD302]|nr:hydrolase TatD [Lewinellaceae bacterium SD302]
MLIDTHTHLYSTKFDQDREEVLERAKAAGVELTLLPAVDSESHTAMLELEAAHPEYCLAMIGLHPVSVKANYEEELALVESELKRRKWVAIGEIGMDLYWDKTFRAEQEDAFLRQCRWAVEYDLPIAIHARDSIDELLELIRNFGDERLRGVFHCFTGTPEQATEAIRLGFYLGIGGVATFKNGGLTPTLEKVDRSRIILETDAPYLAPAPKRGKRNETAYVKYVAGKVAEVWQCEIIEVGRITSTNARQLFDLDRFMRENSLA